MADIELVIKINEDIVQGIIDGENDTPRNIVRSFQATIADAIKNSTPLPKGHGKLKDADELYSIFKKNCDAYNIDNLSFISDMDMNFDLAPTIIEADKED